MGLVINISQVDDEDYDGNPFSYKKAVAVINDVILPVSFSYSVDTENSVIEDAVETDLTNKGYTW